MADDREAPECGPWAVEKLGFLRGYLNAYTKVVRKHFTRFTYIDAFAGPGRHKIREQEADTGPQVSGQRGLLDSLTPDYPDEDGARAAFIDGSPRVALGIDYQFTDYVFVDLDHDRIKKLRNLQVEYPNASIHVRQEDCNAYLAKHIPEIDWSRERAVAFIDPFGMHAPWTTMELLARQKAIEVFVNFPVGMAMQYFLRRDGNIEDRYLQRLDEYLGTRDWFNVIYDVHEDLIGRTLVKREDSGHRLACWYAARLRGLFGYASPPRLVRNTKGSYLYYLIWAGPNETGLKIATHVLKSGELVNCRTYGLN